MLPRPYTAGRTSKSDHFTLPAGSLFGLPVEEKDTSNGRASRQVVPAEIARIANAFGFEGLGVSREEKAKYVLRQLTHISQAYRHGALKHGDITTNHIPSDPLYEVIRPFSFNIKYAVDSPEYDSLLQFFNKYRIRYDEVVGTLVEINRQYLHIPQKHFASTVAAILSLPKNNGHFRSYTPDEAFELAKTHHNSATGSFVRIYRRAQNTKLRTVAERMSCSRQYVRKCESKEPGVTVLKKALEPGNAWQLPENGHGHIRADVVEYLRHFEWHAKERPLPESYWLSPAEALAQYAGVESESHGHTALNDLQQQVAASLAGHEKEPFPLLHLGGHDVLAKRDGQGRVQLYTGDLGPWLQQFAQQEMRHKVDTPADSWTHRMTLSRNPADPANQITRH